MLLKSVDRLPLNNWRLALIIEFWCLFWRALFTATFISHLFQKAYYRSGGWMSGGWQDVETGGRQTHRQDRYTCSETAKLILGLSASEQNIWNQPVCLQVRRRWVYGLFSMRHLSQKHNTFVFVALTSSQENIQWAHCRALQRSLKKYLKRFVHGWEEEDEEEEQTTSRQTCSYIIFSLVLYSILVS